MGTRRSKHNKGRKALYKDHRTVAMNLIARPLPGRYWTGCNWASSDELKLSILCEADADIEASADVLGRKPSAIAHRAKDTGLTLPRQWSQLILPKRSKREVISRPSGQLAYPYLGKAKPEHADILAINAIVPKALPEHVRADVCQEIMIAILEGRTTLEKLRSRKGSASYFIRRFYKNNYEDGGRALSFSIEDNRSYDEIASSIAAKEWHHEQLVERHRFSDSIQIVTPPTQLEAVWRDQVGRFRLAKNEIGQFLSFEEAANLLEAA